MTVAPIVPRTRSHRVRDAVGRRPVLLLVALGLACALVAWLRLPAVAHDTFWAEDGRTFVSSAALGGPVVLLQPYAGYLHTIPRLVAAVVVLLPVSWWALATTAAACAIAGALAVVVFVCARDLVPWLPARLFVAGLTVLAPLAPREVLGNLANLHSLILWTLFWIVLSRPRTTRAAVALAAVAVLGALTEIQAVFLAPLLLLRAHDRRVWIVRAGLIAGMVAQLVVTFAWPRAENTNPAVDPLVAAALAGSVLLYAVSVETNPNAFYDYAGLTRTRLDTVWLTRYGVVPSMLLALVPAVAASIAFCRRRLHRGRAQWPAWSVLAAAGLCAALILAQSGPQWTRRSDGPAWQPQLASAAEQCRRDDELKFVNLRETIGWKVSVPCRYLGTTEDSR